jgi:hypothetical protein
VAAPGQNLKHQFKQRMKNNFINEMSTFFNESPKCHLYRYIFDNNVLQFYLDRPINYIYSAQLQIKKVVHLSFMRINTNTRHKSHTRNSCVQWRVV